MNGRYKHALFSKIEMDANDVDIIWMEELSSNNIVHDFEFGLQPVLCTVSLPPPFMAFNYASILPSTL
jgi:hypothetical protein